MSTPKNSLMVVLLTTIVSFGIYAEDQQPQNPQTTQFDLAECLQAASISYKKHAQKMEPLCNPVGLVGTAITSAFLGAKKLGFLALGVVVVVNSPAIKKQIEEYSALNQEKTNQDIKIKVEPKILLNQLKPKS